MWKDRVEYKLGDITKENVDAIVNAANRWLKGGGGVDGAIHRAAGEKLREALRRIGYCETGKAVLTEGFKLKAKWIIHAVGPVYRGRMEDAELLKSAYTSALEIAAKIKARRVAFPLISTGAYGYPAKEAIEIALSAVKAFLEKNEYPKKVIFVIHDREKLSIFKDVFERISSQA